MKQKVLILSLFFLFVMIFQIFTINGISLQEGTPSTSVTPLTAEHAKIPTTTQLQQPMGSTKQISQTPSHTSQQTGQTTFPFNYQNGNYTTHTYLNSSFGNPGQAISFKTNSTYVSQGQDWSTFKNYNNSYYYTLTSPTGTVVYNSTPVYLLNNTLSTSSLQGAIGQANLTTYYNFSSVDFLKSVAFLSMNSLSPTVEQVNFTTNGKALGTIFYSTSTSTILSQHVSDRSYLNDTHSLLIRNLQANTKYYFIINATDIFGTTLSDTNQGSFRTFTTPAISTTPILGNLTVTVSSNGAVIAFNVAPKANATVNYGLTTSLGSPVVNGTYATSFKFSLSLQPAQLYYFDVVFNNTFTDSNFGNLYNFTTLYSLSNGMFVNPGTLRALQLNTSMERISFTTSIVTNATIFYGTSLSQVPTIHTQTLNNSATFTFYIPLDPTKSVITYYYYIQLSTTQTVDIDNNNNNFGIPYYTFTTTPPAPINTGFINITVQLPVFPVALLGIWQFTLHVVKNITITNVKQPLIVLPYASTFILNDTLNYATATTYMQRGTTFNGTSKNIVPNYVPGYPTTFSPGDHGLFIGQIHYLNISSPVNNNSMSLRGSVDVVFNNIVYSNVGTFLSLPATSVGLNSSLTTSYNYNSTYFMINFTIPLANIYGNADIQLNLQFPGNQTYSKPGYIQTLQLPLSVKYLLGITNHPPINQTYYYTQALNGSVSILPYIYNDSFFVSHANYTLYNYSRVIAIPSNLLPVTVLQTNSNSQNESVAQVSSYNYSWSWLRSQLDFGISAGKHNINFTWSYGNHRIPLFTTVTTFTGNESAYFYTYNIAIAYGVNDLTEGLINRPGTSVTLRFQIVVPQTNIPITSTNFSSLLGFNSSNIINVTSATPSYNPVTAEYSIQVNIASSTTTGNYSLEITIHGINISDYTGNKDIQVTVDRNAPNPLTGFTTTSPVQQKSLRLTDYAIMGLGVVGFAAYVVVILFYLRRK